MSRRTQKVEIHLGTERSGFALFSMILGHNIGNNVGNELGLMLRRKRPRKSDLSYDIAHIHSLVINTGLIEYHIVGDTMLCCFVSLSELKAGDIITTGQYINS